LVHIYIVQYLLEQGHQVRVLDNFSSGFRENLDGFPNQKHLSFIEGDIRNFKIVKKCAENRASCKTIKRFRK